MRGEVVLHTEAGKTPLHSPL